MNNLDDVLNKEQWKINIEVCTGLKGSPVLEGFFSMPKGYDKVDNPFVKLDGCSIDKLTQFSLVALDPTNLKKIINVPIRLFPDSKKLIEDIPFGYVISACGKITAPGGKVYPVDYDYLQQSSCPQPL